MTTLTIELPDKLAQQAKEAGLLSSDALVLVLKDAMRSRAIDELFAAADELAAANFPPMTMDEIQAEVNAVRSKS